MINWECPAYDFFIENFEGIKKDYDNLFVPFFDRKNIRIFKTEIYSLKISVKKKDTMWELLNNDLLIEDIRELDKNNN